MAMYMISPQLQISRYLQWFVFCNVIRDENSKMAKLIALGDVIMMILTLTHDLEIVIPYAEVLSFFSDHPSMKN